MEMKIYVLMVFFLAAGCTEAFGREGGSVVRPGEFHRPDMRQHVGIPSVAVSVYPYRMDPRRHPDDARRWVKPPDRGVLGDQLLFMGALRDFNDENFERELDRIVGRDDMGSMIWANCSIFKNAKLEAQMKELKRRGLFLFDIWGYYPEGFDPANPKPIKHPRRVYGDYRPSPENLAMFERVLGDHWLGMDNGEQDGRYIGWPGYGKQYEPFGVDRVNEYRHFQHHFEDMDLRHGNRMAALVSATYGHYYLRSGCYTSIGAETGQALPNSQLYYSFLRGAGKQYGVPWFGNVSVFNRWGAKSYKLDSSTATSPVPIGPAHGTSLALLKKLLYAQIFYNSFAVGFECSHYQLAADGKTEELSPVGRIHQGARDWSRKYGDPGTMHTPVALMFDFFAGWEPPQHLYAGEDGFRVWGTMPYEASDYFAHGVFSLLYPEYEAASFYHDEHGFNADTPFGDIADSILSDASPEFLSRYPVVVLCSKMRSSRELADTLAKYVAGGGHLVMTRGNATALFPKGVPAGRVTVFDSEWGVVREPVCGKVKCGQVDRPMQNPHPLEEEVRTRLTEIFREQMIFDLEEPQGRSLITCRRGRDDYTVAVLNNTWQDREVRLVARAGRIVSVEELPTPDDMHGEVGYAPKGVEPKGGEVRMFRVKLDEGEAVVERNEVPERPNAANRVYVMRGNGELKDEPLVRPTFFRHYDTMLVDWRWFEQRTEAEIARQMNWPKLQGLKLMLDFRSGFNYYPDLRIPTIKSIAREKETLRRMKDVLAKAALCGIGEVVISEDRGKDNKDEIESMEEGFAKILALPEAKGMIFWQCGNLMRESRYRPGRGWQFTDCWENAKNRAKRLGTNVFRPAYRVAAELYRKSTSEVAAEIRRDRPALVFLSAPAVDRNGHHYSLSRPFAEWGTDDERNAVIAAIRAVGARIVYDAVFADVDAEYAEVRKTE